MPPAKKPLKLPDHVEAALRRAMGTPLPTARSKRPAKARSKAKK